MEVGFMPVMTFGTPPQFGLKGFILDFLSARSIRKIGCESNFQGDRSCEKGLFNEF
jgi:hypothetical protein